jgi:hypothetical protein
VRLRGLAFEVVSLSLKYLWAVATCSDFKIQLMTEESEERTRIYVSVCKRSSCDHAASVPYLPLQPTFRSSPKQARESSRLDAPITVCM